jgi:hypothetical protein
MVKLIYRTIFFIRYMWSDKSGRHPATKESIRLPSSAWQWTADWTVDYYTPGGVDK